MTLLFSESFDIYGTSANLAKRWDSTSGALTFTPSGRTGSALVTTSGTLTKFVPNNNEFIVGFAFLFTSTTGGPTNLVQFKSGSTVHITLSLTTLENLSVSGSTFTTTTGATILSINKWYYIEIKIKVDNSPNGTIEVRLDENTSPVEITVSGIDTQNLTTNQVDQITFAGSSHTTRIDDLYILDPTKTPNNTFLGDIRVASLLPIANGTVNSSNWNANTGDKYNAVDESTPDDDTTYIANSSNFGIQTFKFDLPFKGTVFGVETISLATKSPGTSRQLSHVTRPTSSNYTSESFSTSDDYFYNSSISDTNPSTSSAWIFPEILNAEWGVQAEPIYVYGLATLYNTTPTALDSSKIGGYWFINDSASVVVTYN